MWKCSWRVNVSEIFARPFIASRVSHIGIYIIWCNRRSYKTVLSFVFVGPICRLRQLNILMTRRQQYGPRIAWGNNCADHSPNTSTVGLDIIRKEQCRTRSWLGIKFDHRNRDRSRSKMLLISWTLVISGSRSRGCTYHVVIYISYWTKSVEGRKYSTNNHILRPIFCLLPHFRYLGGWRGSDHHISHWDQLARGNISVSMQFNIRASE